MNINFPNEVLYPKQKIIHQRGNVYRITFAGFLPDYVLLTSVSSKKMGLICLNNYSNRYTEPIQTENHFEVSSEEFEELINPFQDNTAWEYIGQIEDFLEIKNDSKTTKKIKNTI